MLDLVRRLVFSRCSSSMIKRDVFVGHIIKITYHFLSFYLFFFISIILDIRFLTCLLQILHLFQAYACNYPYFTFTTYLLQIYDLAKETVVCLLDFNADTQGLLDWVIDRCYTGANEVADGCFNALAAVFQTRSVETLRCSQILPQAFMLLS